MASKQDLRRLMQKQRTSAKLNHPMAKYNQLGQLSCVICNIPVKSEIVWPAHLQSKRHKENINNLKTGKTNEKLVSKSSAAQISPSPMVTGHVTTNQVKRKEKITIAETDIPTKKLKDATSALPADFFDSSSEKSKASHISTTGTTNESQRNHSSALPADFFDSSVKTHEPEDGLQTAKQTEAATSIPQSSSTKTQIMADALPEGFFDDPKQDAKARKVEYVDPKELEWEKFQKMVTNESKVSDDIMEGEEEESEMVKDLTELNTLKGCLSRVENLKERQDFLKRKKSGKLKSTSRSQDSDGEDSNDDVDELFNWRAKKAL